MPTSSYTPNFSCSYWYKGSYNKNPYKALEIIKNAHNYINQFKDKRREELISLLVLSKYFDMNS